MSRAAEFATFRALIADTFTVDPAAITPATTAADVDGWDSVSHATLIMTIEDRYGVRFPDSEVFSFQDVGALFARTMQLAAKS
jgi:acyl carrier protein